MARSKGATFVAVGVGARGRLDLVPLAVDEELAGHGRAGREDLELEEAAVLDVDLASPGHPRGNVVREGEHELGLTVDVLELEGVRPRRLQARARDLEVEAGLVRGPLLARDLLRERIAGLVRAVDLDARGAVAVAPAQVRQRHVDVDVAAAVRADLEGVALGVRLLVGDVRDERGRVERGRLALGPALRGGDRAPFVLRERRGARHGEASENQGSKQSLHRLARTVVGRRRPVELVHGSSVRVRIHDAHSMPLIHRPRRALPSAGRIARTAR